jgi:hypothetical protein
VGLGIVNQFAHLCTCPVFPDQLFEVEPEYIKFAADLLID